MLCAGLYQLRASCYSLVGVGRCGGGILERATEIYVVPLHLKYYHYGTPGCEILYIWSPCIKLTSLRHTGKRISLLYRRDARVRSLQRPFIRNVRQIFKQIFRYYLIFGAIYIYLLCIFNNVGIIVIIRCSCYTG